MPKEVFADGQPLERRLDLGANGSTVRSLSNRAPEDLTGTIDPELYRYGVHGREFWVNLTVGPGRY